MENSLPNAVRPFQVPGYVFWFFNAPASFQGYVNKILAEKLDVYIILYLNNILIYIKDAGQGHMEAVQLVLGELRKDSLFANLKKYCFH